MLVDIVRSEGSRVTDEDGTAAGVARLLGGRLDEVEADFVGFTDDSLEDVTKAMLRVLAEHDGAIADGLPKANGVLRSLRLSDTVPEALQAFFQPVGCETLKLVIFDGGEDDASDNGYCAFLLPSSCDVVAELAAAGVTDVAVESGASRGPSL